ncbi:MAG: hypothetical protein UR45_C0003G0033 [candidate division WS6 bacterium GW2011_WS6_33_547]|nr:MAG: hypothetical protein UR36_C0004G0033 [candidate division WS6 bacterium GW2011_GWF1_33_233]KKP55215.1 MAG: hypothetical protein UR45_C0003G0033 [candidate division WS6 bacterium GW2011_WS6_33_547]HBB64870.1 hypothetical protein [Patescibacteria group bacterium]
MGCTKRDVFLIPTERQKQLYEKLVKKALTLGLSKEDAQTIAYHVDKLSSIIINSYINTKGTNVCKT